MKTGHLGMGKVMILVLGVLGPLLLYQAYHNRRELLDVGLPDALSQERNAVMWSVAESFFQEPDILARAVVTRALPDGPLVGLAAFDAEDLRNRAGIRSAETSTAPERWLRLLHDDTRFFSGMPKRYAGLIELFELGEFALTPQDRARFDAVAADFWIGLDLTDDDYRFLLNRLGDLTTAFFHVQRIYLGLKVPEDEAFWALITAEGQRALIAGTEDLAKRLNRRLTALSLEGVFTFGEAWTDIGALRVTLQPEPAPEDSAESTVAYYLAAGILFELILALIFSVLTKYESIHRAQKQLLATTSHELRTPLAVIRQFAEMLIDRKDMAPDRLQTYHQHIHRECLNMQFLVENLLSAAKFEHLDLRLEPRALEIGPWLTELVSGADALTEHRLQIQADLALVGSANWDAGLMQQALLNLLENARLHADSSVDVELEADETTVCIRVRDYGAEPDLPRIRKIKAFSPNGSTSGLGLGLYLVKRIVQAHGGRLTFEAADPGLRVMLRLPRILAKNR